MAKIWVYAEVHEGRLDPAALELLTKARELGDAEAVVLGAGAKEAATKLGEYGASVVHASEDSTYDDYIAQPHAHTLFELIGQQNPDLILFPNTYDARDIAGRLSAKTGSTLMGNATDILSVDKAQTSIFGGTQLVDVDLEGSPKLVLVRPKSFEPSASGGSATVQDVTVDLPEEVKKAKRIERHEEQSSGPKLDAASVVVSGGRGLQEPDNFKLLEELASLLGGAVGATRAVVDAGWVPYAMQIGQTGITVKPGVYIAVGISGATQHMVGMKGAKKIIAINKDEEAPIFSIADIGVVGDALKILPQLIEEVKNRKG